MARLVARDKMVDCRIVIFDKDGTLIDQNAVLLELARARKNAVVNLGGAEIGKHWERLVGVDLAAGKIDAAGPLAVAPRREELFVAAEVFYLSGRSWELSKLLASRAYDDADGVLNPPFGSVLLDGVEETLKHIRQAGLILGVASTDIRTRSIESFRALGILTLFDVIVGVDDVANGKPASDMVLKILEETGYQASDVVVIGDSVNDMLMGKNAGVKLCIGVLTGSGSREKLAAVADVVIDSLSDLEVR